MKFERLGILPQPHDGSVQSSHSVNFPPKSTNQMNSARILRPYLPLLLATYKLTSRPTATPKKMKNLYDNDNDSFVNDVPQNTQIYNCLLYTISVLQRLLQLWVSQGKEATRRIPFCGALVYQSSFIPVHAKHANLGHSAEHVVLCLNILGDDSC